MNQRNQILRTAVTMTVIAALAGCGTSKSTNIVDHSSTLPPTNTISSVNSASHTHPTGSNTTSRGTTTSMKIMKLTTRNHLRIHMVSAQTGWGVLYRNQGGANIVHTSNGGKSWHDVSPEGIGQFQPNGKSFTSGMTAWFTVEKSPSGNTSTQKLTLYHTTNGGQTWTSSTLSVKMQVPVFQTQISVIGHRTIWMDVIPQHGMSSMPGQLMVSHDSGKTWANVQSSKHPPYGGQMAFTGLSTGWLSTANCTTCNRTLYQTINGGESWTESRFPVPKAVSGDSMSLALPTFSTSKPKSGIVYARFQAKDGVIEHRFVYQTTNHGKSWTVAGSLPGQAGLLSFPSTNVGVALPMTMQKTFPTLYETTNGGKAWTQVTLPNTPFSTQIKDGVPMQLDFVSKDFGWIVWGPRDEGKSADALWQTTDGGRHWVRIS